jgi:tetratricopeptide (TPR) repeat protein
MADKKGMTKKDIYKKLDNFKTIKGKIDYLKSLRSGVRIMNPSTRKAYYETLGDVLVENSDFVAADEYYVEAEVEEDKRRKIWKAAGDMAFKDSDFSKAANCYKIAKLNNSRDSKELEKFAESYERSGKPQEAMSLYRKIEHLKKKGKSLGDKLNLAIIGAAFLCSLLFFSGSITGNTILNSSVKTSNLIGAGLFIAGVVVSFFYSERKK